MLGKGPKCENPTCPSTILQPEICSRPVSDQDAASLDTLVADRVKAAPATKQMRAKYAEEVLNEVTQKILGKPLQAVVKKMPFGRNWARKEFRRAAALQRQFTVHVEIKSSVFVVSAN